MLSTTLAQQLKKVEGLETKLSPADIEAGTVFASHAQQLTRFLTLRSEGNASTMIKASVERNEMPWRPGVP